ncbi:EAL domain-containing protein [Pseudopontixanthobacter vadosimaris]|uniref:sensor domain-containing phosphodiesterase n=1 Tax=Pseudopontixanthobacter vadosimaris TaxID=2726450 RepID=UPI001476070E|nr:EAL domain-containing protein [Pseudopontixanthobacter vadosimaris]
MQPPDHNAFLTNEQAQLALSQGLAAFDPAPDLELDLLTKLASHTFRTESAAICLVDGYRQRFTSPRGLPVRPSPAIVAFCARTISPRETMVVLDARTDDRFRNNPLVAGDPNLRFYAGAPLFLSSGHCLGALCVIDSAPRADFTADDVTQLEGLATIATSLIEARQEKRGATIASSVVEATSDTILASDRDRKILFWNKAAEEMFGYTREEALGRNVTLIIPEEFRMAHTAGFDRVAAGGPKKLVGSTVELEARHSGGDIFPVEFSLAEWGDRDGQGGFAAIIRHIAKRKALEAERNQTREFFDTVVSNLPALLFVKDAHLLKYLFVNKHAERLIGKTAEEMIGKTDGELFPGVGNDYERRDSAAASSTRPSVYESEFIRNDGRHLHIRTTRILAAGSEHERQYLIGISEDMTAFRHTEKQNYKLARYDTLTGLFNRSSLLGLLENLVERGAPFALLSIDLDRFKAVNDQYGHLTGDEVLRRFAAFLKELAADGEELARIGGDEFIIIIEGERLRERAAGFAEQLIERTARPIRVGKIPAYIGTSIGIVIHPDDGTAISKLRENADLALYRAKNEGRGLTRFFNEDMDAERRDRQLMEKELRQAVENGEIKLAYQPLVEAATDKVTSVEALARWAHPQRGYVSPEMFVSLAEDCGIIEHLGNHVLRTACLEARGWPSELRLAVNLSPLQFQSNNLVEAVRKILEETQFAPGRLMLEVTERLVIQNVEQTLAQLEGLRALGIEVVMDDFGVGHSSLNYFHRFPFDKVKIDKSFVAEVETSKAAKAIITAVVGLGRQLSMGIVAEGVETESQEKLLVKLGCTHLQGYLFSKPISGEDVRKLNLERSGLRAAA